MNGIGCYSALHRAHQRIETERTVKGAAWEITDRKLERRDRDQTAPQRVERADPVKETARNPAQPSRPFAAKLDALVPNGPAPGESEVHFAWRRLMTQRIKREKAREAAQKADAIPRILRTEKNSIGLRTELRAVFDRMEAERVRKSSTKTSKQKDQSEKEIEPEDR